MTPRLIRHFVDVAVRTRQIATTVDLQDELPEGNRLVASPPHFPYVEVEQRPRSRMRRHANQLAKSSGSVRTPRQACTSNIVTRETANAA